MAARSESRVALWVNGGSAEFKMAADSFVCVLKLQSFLKKVKALCVEISQRSPFAMSDNTL